ncbi:DEAD-domain-containing protein [Daldinia sp. FL1419]|nr:DEAD-domain-containing protein [Daldinia sp. FL1419]
MSNSWGPSEAPAPVGVMQAAGPFTTAAQHAEKPVADWGKPVAFDYTESDVDRQWGSNSAVYEWDGDEGEIGPVNPQLEIQLFGPPEKRHCAGVDFSKIAEISVSQEGEQRIRPIFHFKDGGLHPIMLKNIEMAGYKVPTPIQKYCIPAVKLGYDMIAIAQTGSGKTAAYLIPILNQLMGKAKKLAAYRPSPQEFEQGTAQYVRAEPLVLIVCPARELAIQIFDEARKFCYRTMLRPCVVYGGGPLSEQLKQIGRGCDVLVATPGRLIDIMERSHLFTLRRLRYMVIDEADEMLDMDWQDEFEKILTGGEQEEGIVNYMLFSATFPGAVRKLAKDHLAMNHLRIRVGRIGSSHVNISQEVIFVKRELKREALMNALGAMEPRRTIIFVNSKRTADEIDDYLFHKQLPCTSIHSDRTQREREDAMRAFRAGKTPILVATGVMARGIDVHNVRYIINYDLPNTDHGGIQEYVHRIGRTGRIGYTGYAISFYTERDESIAGDLTKILMETRQPVPDFLTQYIPEGVDPKNFQMDDDKSDFDEGEGAVDTWGTNDQTPGGTWGTESKTGGASSKAAGGDAETSNDWGTAKAGSTTAPKTNVSDDWGVPDNSGGAAWGAGNDIEW